jgi:hypothetical protein
MPNEIIFTLRVLASPHLFSYVEKPITKLSCVPWQSSLQNLGQIVKGKKIQLIICLYGQYKILSCIGHYFHACLPHARLIWGQNAKT